MKIVRESGYLAIAAAVCFSGAHFHAIAAPPGEPPAGKAAPRPGSKKDEKRAPADEGKDAGASEKAGGRSLAEIEKEMKRAHAAKDFARLGKLSDEALETADPAAYRAVIQYALQGEDRELDAHVFNRLVAAEDPAARAVIYSEVTKNASFRTRIILLGVCRDLFLVKKDPAAFAPLAAGLRDRSRPAQLTAVRWIRETKETDRAVPLLIEALRGAEKQQPQSRFYFDVKNALKDFTKVDLELAADFQNYWDSYKAGRAPKPRQSPTRVVPRKADFFSVPLESDQVLFIIDISGSMEKKDPPMPDPAGPEAKKKVEPGKTVVVKTKAQEGKDEKKKAGDDGGLSLERQRIWRVKRELVRIIKAMPENVRFTVESFNHEIHFVGDAPKLTLATPDNKKRAEDWVNALQPNGETWTDEAFARAFKELPEVDTIYFLSDGMPWRNGAKVADEKVLTEIREANRFTKCRIHSFGFLQEGANLKRFMEAVAKQNDGKFTPLR